MNSTQAKKSTFLSISCMFLVCLLGGFLIVNQAVAADIAVCPTCTYTSIEAGINAATSGDRVVVGTPGRTTAESYDGTFGITKGVNVVSEGDDTTTTYIDGAYSTTALERATLTIISDGSDSVVRIPGGTTPDVTLDGFTIENAGVDDLFLIRISGGSPIIKNNIIRNNTGAGHAGGIGLQGFGAEVSPTIENNIIHNVNGPGIGNGPDSHATIRDNEIWDCKGSEGPGIGLWGNAYPAIENNIIFGNNRAGVGSYGFGLNAYGGSLIIPVIKGNTIYDNNQAGIRLSRADSDTGTINVTIGDSSSGNEIYGNQAGIRLDDLTSGTIENNNIHDHDFSGIRLDGLTSATIHNNQIHHLQYMAGIRLDNIGDVTVSDNDIHHSQNVAGIICYAAVAHATVENNKIHHNGKAGIKNQGAITLIVQNNNEIYSNSLGGILIDNEGSTNTIQLNTIRDNLRGGIRVVAAASVTVQDNNIYSNGRGGIKNVAGDSLAVSANDIYDNGYGGVEINYGAGSITGNTINQNNRGGIAIKAPCTFDITNNTICGNIRGGVHTGDDSADGGGYTGTIGDAHLTIKKNKVYSNGQSGYGGGIDVRHADGTIYNNLVYKNHRGGIRFGDYIDEIVNNTVVGNGADDSGGGIIYDDLAGAVNDPPGGCAPFDIPIKNNICTHNEKAGINVKICPDNACPSNRDYNLLCRNHGINTDTCSGPPYCIRRQLGGCDQNDNEIFDNPLFVAPATDNYQLQTGSPAECAGECQSPPCECTDPNKTDMGAYGGSDPMTP